MKNTRVDNENTLVSEQPPVVLTKAVYHSPEIINLNHQDIEGGGLIGFENEHGALPCS